MNLSEIKTPIKSELSAFEAHFRASMKSSVTLLDKLTQYVLKQKGKQIRPLFVFYAAKLNNGITDSTYDAASLIELLHTATLIHDDVVDEADQRRGMFSLNALWKNKIAVLVGDYLLSKGLLISLENEQYHLLRIVTKAVKEMSEGELLQLEKARNFNADEDTYFEIIKKKTASLIAACCACGAASSGAGEDQVKKMWKFGELIGLAFQIKDDLFDMEKNAKTGKRSGNDIKEQKFTLPLIYAFSQASAKEKRNVINLIKNAVFDDSELNKVYDFIHEKGGVNYAEEKMNSLTEQALNILNNEFEDKEAKKYLTALVNYTINRKK